MSCVTCFGNSAVENRLQKLLCLELMSKMKLQFYPFCLTFSVYSSGKDSSGGKNTTQNHPLRVTGS